MLRTVLVAGALGLITLSPLAQEPTPQPTPEPPPAAVRGYVYLEPFEIRQEFVLELAALADQTQGSASAGIATGDRAAALARLRERLAAACDVSADGNELAFEFTDLQFVQIDPKLGPIADEREMIPRETAVVAAVLTSPRDGFPKQLEITWRLFPPANTGSSQQPATVPVEIQLTAPRASHSHTLQFSPQQQTQSWQIPAITAASRLRAIADVRGGARTTPIIVASVFMLLGVGILGLGLRRRSGKRTGFWIAGALALLLGGGSLYGKLSESAAAGVSEIEAAGIVESLLNNVYHAFAYRTESTIFDTLEHSVEGPLLEQLYLDIRRGLDVEDDGGPRVRVLAVTLVSCELQRATTGGLQAGVVWVSEGNVSHWGHEHRRRNQYRGELQIDAVDGRWKLSGVKILEEERT